MKRQDAINAIKYEVARHGKATKKAMRIYTESSLGWKAYRNAVKAGRAKYKELKRSIGNA